MSGNNAQRTSTHSFVSRSSGSFTERSLSRPQPNVKGDVNSTLRTTPRPQFFLADEIALGIQAPPVPLVSPVVMHRIVSSQEDDTVTQEEPIKWPCVVIQLAGMTEPLMTSCEDNGIPSWRTEFLDSMPIDDISAVRLIVDRAARKLRDYIRSREQPPSDEDTDGGARESTVVVSADRIGTDDEAAAITHRLSWNVASKDSSDESFNSSDTESSASYDSSSDDSSRKRRRKAKMNSRKAAAPAVKSTPSHDPRTVAQLKRELKTHGLPVSGRKSMLLRRLANVTSPCGGDMTANDVPETTDCCEEDMHHGVQSPKVCAENEASTEVCLEFPLESQNDALEGSPIVSLSRRESLVLPTATPVLSTSPATHTSRTLDDAEVLVPVDLMTHEDERPATIGFVPSEIIYKSFSHVLDRVREPHV